MDSALIQITSATDTGRYRQLALRGMEVVIAEHKISPRGWQLGAITYLNLP